ncbi:hypothetical protein V2J09_010135 [Rumex salicifolius]
MATYSKEHEALVHYPILQLDSGPWWGSIGSNCQLKSNQANQSKWGTHGKGIESHGTISWDGQKIQPLPATSVHSALPDYHTWLEIGYSPSMICPKSPYADQTYSLLSTYGPQIGGRIMLPLSLTTDEEPVFVNAKQYHGILRRRQSRAKAELLNKPLRAVRKQYLHESRHLHAKRRARGAGGRFLNTATKSQDTKKCHSNLAQPCGSQNSEVLQSDINGGNLATEAVSRDLNNSNSFHGDFGFLFNIGVPPQPSPMHTTPAVKWGDYFNLKI